MKNLSLILAILFLAFTVEAQTVERSKREKEKKTTKTSVSKKAEKPSKTKKVKAPAKSKTSATRSSSSTKKPSTARKASSSSSSKATRSSSTKPQTRTKVSTPAKTSSSRDGASRTVSTRKVNTVSSKSSARSNTSRVVNAPKVRTAKSNRSKVYTPKTSVSHAASRKVYVNNYGHRVKRKVVNVNYKHQSINYRRVHNPYNKPRVFDLFWSANMYRDYRNWYPNFNLWYYPYGYRIHTISAYDSYNYIGEVARVYGRVTEVWYSRDSREYYLYVGGPYPYQDFTIILDKRDARRYSWDPERYFTNRHISATGLVSLFEDKPEMQIRKRSQISLY